MKKQKINFLLTVLASIFLPFAASAHEVYVLSTGEIAHDMTFSPLNLFAVAVSHGYEFLTIAFFAILIIVCVFGISLIRGFERLIDPFLLRIKPYASHIAQVTIGSALLFSAYHGALFGTELPIAHLFGRGAVLATILLYISGASILLGIWPRLGGLVAALVFLWSIPAGGGTYMLSYLLYFGEASVLFLFGGAYSIVSHIPHISEVMQKIFDRFAAKKYLILRISFSISLMYAALYAKLIHGELALNTVMKYHLTNYFHFDPLFIVLGAFLIEMTIALFFLIGFELRFTALFFLTFLTLSLCFFGESLWPHVVLIGTGIVMFTHGYDEYTVEKVWYRKGEREPVL